jgi:hypothetical protein
MPTFNSPWQNLLANAVQGLAGAGLQAYGIHSTNQANAENAAKMVPQLAQMGVSVPEGVSSGLSSQDPQTRALALALTDKKMKKADDVEAQQAELEKYRQQQGIQFDNQKQLKQMELDAQRSQKDSEANQQRLTNTQSLRTSLNGLKETEDFKTASTTYQAMEKAAGIDSKAADLIFKKAFERVSNPGSVVSPTEAQALNDIQSFYDQNQGRLDAFFGGGELSAPVRKQMLEIARNYRNGLADTYEQAAQPYLKDASDFGISKDRILTVPFLSEKKRDPEAWAAKNKGGDYEKQFGGTAAPLNPAAVAGPAPQGSAVVSAAPPADNVALPYGLPPLNPGLEYWNSPDGLKIVRKK